MSTLIGIALTSLMLLCVKAQPTSTNSVDRATAIKAASQLAVGMREEVAERLLATNGLRNPMKMGCSHGWSSFYTLSDRCSLAIEIAPKRARSDGAWADGLVKAAVIQNKNGENIVSITLTNRP
jgi:hypothetical protein